MRKGLNGSLIAACVCILVMVLACKHYRASASSPQARPGPRSLNDVIQLAEAMQLHYRSDAQAGYPTGKVFLSEWPVSYEGIQKLHMHGQDDRNWIGTVAVSLDGEELYSLNYDPEHPDRTALWGSLFLYGDPVLIRQLMEQHEITTP